MCRLTGRDVRALADVRADGEKCGIEVALAHVVEDAGDLRVALEGDPEVEDPLDLGVQHVARQPVARDAKAHHASGHRPGFTDRHRVPAARQLIGGGQARRAGADDQHALAARLGVERELPATPYRLVAEEALDAVDADGLVELASIAGGLAGVVADASHDRRQRVVADELAPRGLVVTGLRVVEPLLDVLARRTGVVARRQAVNVTRAFVAPGSGLVRQARSDVEGYCEWLVHQRTPSVLPSRPKRRMLRSAPAWMRAITSVRCSGANRCAKRFCNRR